MTKIGVTYFLDGPFAYNTLQQRTPDLPSLGWLKILEKDVENIRSVCIRIRYN